MTHGIVRLSVLFLICLLSIPAAASTVVKEIDRVASEVAVLELGFDSYVLGKPLTDRQKETAKKNPIKKVLKGTYKFKDREIFIIAAVKNDIVLGVYKEYPETSSQQLKNIIGTLMLEYGEPTATAHDKIIYWSYDKNGKIDQDTFDFARQSGGAKSVAAIKFSNSEIIAMEDDGKDKTAEKKSSAYLMITSDPLSKLFLANQTDKK